MSTYSYYKIRLANAEFWQCEEENVTVDEEFDTLAEVREAILEFLNEIAAEGMDYTADDIEVIEFVCTERKVPAEEILKCTT